ALHLLPAGKYHADGAPIGCDDALDTCLKADTSGRKLGGKLFGDGAHALLREDSLAASEHLDGEVEQARAGAKLAVEEDTAEEGAGEVIYKAVVAEVAAAQFGVDALVALFHGTVEDGLERAAPGGAAQTERAQLVTEGEQGGGEGRA